MKKISTVFVLAISLMFTAAQANEAKLYQNSHCIPLNELNKTELEKLGQNNLGDYVMATAAGVGIGGAGSATGALGGSAYYMFGSSVADSALIAIGLGSAAVSAAGVAVVGGGVYLVAKAYDDGLTLKQKKTIRTIIQSHQFVETNQDAADLKEFKSFSKDIALTFLNSESKKFFVPTDKEVAEAVVELNENSNACPNQKFISHKELRSAVIAKFILEQKL